MWALQRSRWRVARCILVLGTAGVAGCMGDFLGSPGGPKYQAPPAARLMVFPETITLDAFGSTGAFRAGWWQDGNVTMSGGCSWSISNSAIATIRGDGTATANGNGQAEVRATCGDTTATATIGVWQGIAFVSADPTSLRLEPGETADVLAAARDANDNPVTRPVTFSWSSSDEMVADVSADPETSSRAVITRYFPGTATVIVRGEGKVGNVRIR